MTLEEQALRALELAQRNTPGASAEDIVKDAAKFRDFLTGRGGG